MSIPAAGLSLSFSSYQLFSECPRRFALQHLADRLPVPLRWTVQLQRRLAPLTTFAGKIVDLTLGRALVEFRREGRWPGELYGTARELAGEWWRYSQAWVHALQTGRGCPIDRRFQPLDRHYYDEEVRPAELESIKERVRESLANWLSSDLPVRIANSASDTWRGSFDSSQRRQPFSLHGIPVWAAPDFAFLASGKAEIFDWKTGSINPASYLRTVDQLHWYALLAVRAWGVAPEAVRLVPVWLAPQLVANELEITREELDSLEWRIRERHTVLTGLLGAQAGCGPELALELWPLTEHVEFCRTCPFRGSCEGACRMQSSGPEPVFADPFAGSFAA